MRIRDFPMFLPSVCSRFCLSSSMFRPVTLLFVLTLYDSNVAVFACKSVNRFACCFCHCFNLVLLLQDHGFDPPYRSNCLPIVNFLYAYIETSTLKEILLDTADINDRRRTQHTVKISVAS